MKQLGAIQYDPAAAVTKATTGNTAMAAFDTTNARLTVTVPKSGRIGWKVQTAAHGGSTTPQVLLGVMDGATVRARKAAMTGGGTVAATTIAAVWAEGTMTGLTPGASITLDAAWACETGVAASGLKYGGPNDTTTNNAFGALTFELTDPDPYNVNATGQIEANVEKWNTVDVANLPANWHSLAVDASGRVTVGSIVNGAIAAATFAANALDAVWSTATRLLTAGTNIVLAKGTGITGFNDLSAAQVNAEADTALADVGLTGAVTGRIDASISSRLAVAGYTAPDNVTISAISAKTANLPSDPADQSLIIAAADQIRTDIAALPAPDNAGIAAIQAKTDSLNFTIAGKLDVNVLYFNGGQVVGTGAEGDRWRSVV